MDPPKVEIRERLLHECRLKRNATVAAQNVNEALGRGVVSANTAQFWFCRFWYGDTGTTDKPRSGRRREVDREAVLAAIQSDPCQSTRALAEDFGCSH